MAQRCRRMNVWRLIATALWIATPVCAWSQAMASSGSGKEVTLDTLFSRFRQCQFGNFHYAPWDTATPIHPYFAQRALVPHREKEGLYEFRVRDALFGLPVVALFVPGTWDFHGVVFDVPLATARDVMRQRFGSSFAESRRSRNGEIPMLVAYQDNPRQQSMLACAERPYRER